MPKRDRDWWAEHCHLSSGELEEQYLRPQSAGWRKRIRAAKREFPDLPWRYDSRSNSVQGTVAPPPKKSDPPDAYRETVEFRTDGGYTSDRLLEMSMEQAKDPAYLLEAHGFDPGEWEIASAKNSIWNVYSKGEDGHDVSTLYSSRITVKPRIDSWTVEDLVEATREVASRTTQRSQTPQRRGKGLLEVMLHDMHWGIANSHFYEPQLAKIIDSIESNPWSEIVLGFGSDAFHVNNFQGTTVKGTQVEQVDIPQAWADALTFFAAIIDAALATGAEVAFVFVPGNHDELLAWAFAQLLATMYPMMRSDTANLTRKVHRWKDVAIGFAHGDKGKDFDRIFMAESDAFKTAKVREIHVGHVHHERVQDVLGTVVRWLPTAAKTDAWTDAQGYVGTNKRFQLFEYSEDGLEGTRYV